MEVCGRRGCEEEMQKGREKWRHSSGEGGKGGPVGEREERRKKHIEGKIN